VADRLARTRGVLTQADVEQTRRDVARIAAVGDEPQTMEGPVVITGDLTVQGVQATDATTGGNVELANASLRVLNDGAGAFNVSKTDESHVFTVNANSLLAVLWNGADLVFFSDEGVTETARISGEDGLVSSTAASGLWEAGFHANYGAATYTTTGMAAVTTNGSLTGFNTVPAGPGVTHTTGAVSGNIAQAISAVSWRPDWGIDAVFRIRSGADVTNVRYWVGLFASDPSGSSVPAIEFAGFRFDDSADTNWGCRTNDGGGSPTITNSGVPPAASTTQTLRIKTTDGLTYRFYIDGVLVATHGSTLPTTTTQLFAYVSVTTRAAETNAIRVHHVKVLSR
jgi:hypothetical protein